jgi:TonB family protein
MYACAEQGHIKAIHKVSKIYIELDGSEQKVREALKLYENALLAGDVAAAGALAQFYYSRAGNPGAMEKAVGYAKQAYEGGEPVGTFVYAQMHLYGKGIPENIAEGMKIMRALSNRGNFDAKNFLEKMEAIAAGRPRVPSPRNDWPIKVSPPDYPDKAVRKHICGYGTVEFNLDERGSPYEIRIVESYPDGIFDASAQKAAKRIRFTPAKDVGGRDPEMRVFYTYNYVLGDGCSRK